jgi:hypothetical protein
MPLTDAGLSQSLQAQLAVDIQASGGLDNCVLSKLCNKKPEIYGAKGSICSATKDPEQSKWLEILPEI